MKSFSSPNEVLKSDSKVVADTNRTMLNGSSPTFSLRTFVSFTAFSLTIGRNLLSLFVLKAGFSIFRCRFHKSIRNIPSQKVQHVKFFFSHRRQSKAIRSCKETNRNQLGRDICQNAEFSSNIRDF